MFRRQRRFISMMIQARSSFSILMLIVFRFIFQLFRRHPQQSLFIIQNYFREESYMKYSHIFTYRSNILLIYYYNSEEYVFR